MERFRLDVDLEARLRSETFARQVGPRPFAGPRVLTALRDALLAGKIVRLRYGEVLFHPTQEVTDEADGSLIVRFRVGGLLQMAHHLMTWGAAVTIIAPKRLEEMMWEEVAALHDHHRPSLDPMFAE